MGGTPDGVGWRARRSHSSGAFLQAHRVLRGRSPSCRTCPRACGRARWPAARRRRGTASGPAARRGGARGRGYGRRPVAPADRDRLEAAASTRSISQRPRQLGGSGTARAVLDGAARFPGLSEPRSRRAGRLLFSCARHFLLQRGVTRKAMPGRVVPYLAPGAPFSTRRFALLSRGSARRLPARPSILAITSELPWPLDRGGHLRSFHLLRGLAADFDLRLVAPIEPGQESLVPALSAEGIRVCAVPVGQRRAPIETLRVFRAALTREPYVLFRRHDRASVRHSVETQVAVNRPDLLYLDHLDSALYADACRVPAILDVHNVYSALVRRTAEEQPHRIVGQYLRGEARLLERAERRAGTREARGTPPSAENSTAYHNSSAARPARVASGVNHPPDTP